MAKPIPWERPELAGLADGDGREAPEPYLEHRQIGVRIRSEHRGARFAAVLEHDRDRVGAADQVVVGDDVSLGAHDHAGAAAAGDLRGCCGRRVGEIALEKGIVQERAGQAGNGLGGVDIDDGRRGDGHRPGIGDHVIVTAPGNGCRPRHIRNPLGLQYQNDEGQCEPGRHPLKGKLEHRDQSHVMRPRVPLAIPGGASA